jgi:anti-sigma factor RsiW
MNDRDETIPQNDDHIERLICRALDGELSGEDRSVLDRILAEDPAAQALFDEYRRNDEEASAALKREFSSVMTVVVARPRRGLWLAAAGAVLAAAAVVALSFAPAHWSAGPSQVADQTRRRSQNVVPSIAQPMFVDYRDASQVPMQRIRDLNRDVIGIPGSDKNTIYILERNLQSTRVSPISGEF